MRHGLGLSSDMQGDAGYWFGEDQARYVVQVSADHVAAFTEKAARDNVFIAKIGEIGGSDLTITDTVLISIEELNQINESWLPDLMSGKTA
jgi:phosphoribosylformylglycinamidine synthase